MHSPYLIVRKRARTHRSERVLTAVHSFQTTLTPSAKPLKLYNYSSVETTLNLSLSVFVKCF